MQMDPVGSRGIAVMPTLFVSSSGSGSIEVPSSAFGHGWCLVVYSNASLAAVLTTRAV
jgi:hypothetical protein